MLETHCPQMSKHTDNFRIKGLDSFQKHKRKFARIRWAYLEVSCKYYKYSCTSSL